MDANLKYNSHWIAVFMESRWTWLLARLTLTSPFWISGLAKLFDFSSAIDEQRHFGLRPAFVIAILTIIVQLVGSALVIANRWIWVGAGALGVFTAAATLIAHAFWTMHDHERFLASNAFVEHVGLIGGLLLATLLTHARQLDTQRHPL